MASFNLSATLNVLRLVGNPYLAFPQLVVPTFNQIPIPITTNSNVQIKAVVLDKDNCFAKAYDDKVWPEYEKHWVKLRNQYPDHRLLVVSNSAGTNDDAKYEQAKLLEERMGVHVLRHSTKKPGCHLEIMQYFKTHGVTSDPREVAVIGDRLFTDVLMANMMGAYAVWVSNGVKLSQSPICKFERWIYHYLK